MPNTNFVIALFTAIAGLAPGPLPTSAGEPPALLVVTLPIPPDPSCAIHVGIRVPPTRIKISPALLTPLSRTLQSSERATLWVGGQLAHHTIYLGAALPLTLGESDEINTNHGWHPGPVHTISGCLDRAPTLLSRGPRACATATSERCGRLPNR